MPDKYLVCYDIADERRLNRIYRYTKQFGIHLQYSVFVCSFTEKELEKYKKTLLTIINVNEDDVRIYPLPENPKIYTLGQAQLIPDGVVP
ncbi:CRISPR-associated endonuclease Cas2 [Thermodesulfovibrio hydrogeniphilus]